MYKQDYTKYLSPNNKPTKKDLAKKIWGWTKLALFLLVIVSMLWGCVQMFIPDYALNKVTDMTGKSVYLPGTTFEIVLGFLGDYGDKSHQIIIGSNGELVQVQYLSISNWGEAFTKTGGSLFYGLFVFPISFLLVSIVRLFTGIGNPQMDFQDSSFGVAVLFALLMTCIIVRFVTLAFTWKTQKNQEKMQGLQVKQAEIQAKYKNSTDPSAKQRQQMELMTLYKKEGISPLSSIASAFMSMPFLFAMYSVVRSTHALKVASVGQISFIETPWEQVTSGNTVYLALIMVYLPLQIISMFLPTILQIVEAKGKASTEQQRKARKKQMIIQGVFVFMFIFIVSSIASGVAIYWIFSSTFQILQTLGFHYAKRTKPARIRKKLEKKRLALKNGNSSSVKNKSK